MIYISSSRFKSKDIEAVIAEAIRYNITNLELSGGANYSETFIDKLIYAHQKLGFHFLVHNYFPPPIDHFILNIAATNEKDRKRSVAFAKNSIELATKIGSPVYSIHSGYLAILNISKDGERFEKQLAAMNDVNEAMAAFKQSLKELITHASVHNISLAVENLFPESDEVNFSLLCRSEEIALILDQFSSHKKFGLLLDLGHAYLASKLMGFDLNGFLETIMRYQNRIMQIHVSHNDGCSDRHLIPPRMSWMVDFVIRSGLSDVPITIESRNESLKDVIAFKAYLETKIQELK